MLNCFVPVILLIFFVSRPFALTVKSTDLFNYLHNPMMQGALKYQKPSAQRITEHGYIAETHKVVTEDGYILTMYRLPFSPKAQTKSESRPIVLLQHGLFSCSDVWLLMDSSVGLPFMLADAGYDVWLGNARGNTYARNHTTRRATSSEFWKFTWHEIGHYDLSAMIDYVLATKNGRDQKSLHYVGHSQGTTALLVLLSTRPTYNAKIRTVHMLAPVAFMAHVEDKLIRTLAPYLGRDTPYATVFGGHEFIPFNELFMMLGYNVCNTNSPLLALCSGIAHMLEGNLTRKNISVLMELMETHPAGASTDQIRHYMQQQQSGRFCQFDWGASANIKIYGHTEPPSYSVEQISTELHLWYSDNDNMVAVKDVQTLAELLPNRVLHHVEDALWDHGDFVFGDDVYEVINTPVLAIMRQYDTENDSK